MPAAVEVTPVAPAQGIRPIGTYVLLSIRSRLHLGAVGGAVAPVMVMEQQARPLLRSGDSLIVFALLSRPLVRELRCAADELGLLLEIADDVESLVHRIETDCPAVVVVDADGLPGVAELFQFARSLRADAVLVGITCFWSEKDHGIRRFADAIIHKPLRGDEWRRVLASPRANHAQGGAALPIGP